GCPGGRRPVTLLHAVWSADDRLHLWGEQPLTAGRLPRPRGRAPTGGRPRRHPYATRAADLRTALGELTGVAVTSLPVRETHLALPTGATSPLPSPDLPGASDVAEAG